MYLKTSTAGLQDDLRDTMRTYQEEKLHLRAHLSTLRLDLSQLHRDDRTISTEDQSCGASHVSFPASSEADPELKRLAEEEEGEDDTKTARSGFSVGTKAAVGGSTATQLPALKGVPHAGVGGATATKSLRFSTAALKSQPADAEDSVDGGGNTRRSFLKDDWWDAGGLSSQMDPLGLGNGTAQEAKEQQKFKELQKNQDLLRSIGRANLREKRISLIRLPTITSAKKRGQTTWDSGQNVSRPAGKSTAFESHDYVEASSRLKKKNFKIPAIRDPHRSEVQLDPAVQRQPDNHGRKRVQFTRPGEVTASTVTWFDNPNMTAASSGTLNTTSGAASTAASTVGGSEDPHNESMMGGESLNTTLADTTLGDTSFQDISFDEEQIKALAMRGSIDKGGVSMPGSENSSPRKVPGEETASVTAVPGLDLPPLKVKSLRRKNVILHDLNTSGFSTLLQDKGPPGRAGNWDKASDMSVLTKISRLSVETEEWKNNYMSVPDPDKRNKTLSDIMFAVRTRMRENEASLRFGETPRPSDEAYDYLMPDPFGNHLSPRRARKTPRKSGKVKKGKGGANIHAPQKRRVAPEGGGQTAAQLQGYLRKVYRHRRGAAGGGGGSGGRSGRTGRVQKPCNQEAAKMARQRGMRLPVAQEA